jgi:predicted homoserine dehydrogenase-like protein
MRPRSEGGVLEAKGQVEVVSCLTADGAQIPNDIRKGVWVCFEGDSEYIRNYFEEYNVVTDPSGRYMSSYKKWHLIGLELGISVASIALRREPTGVATTFNADVVATAKKDLRPGDMLDGEGGYAVFGKLTPSNASLANGYLPLGLAAVGRNTLPRAGSPPATCRRILAGASGRPCADADNPSLSAPIT